MRTPILLRIASVITMLFAVGHGMGAMESWSPPGETAVLRSMKSFRFDAMGEARTYWEFYVGFGLYITALLLLQGAVLWQLASVARTDPLRVRPMIASFLLASIACAFLAWRFIFLVPVAFSLAIGGCLAVAFLTSLPDQGARAKKLQ